MLATGAYGLRIAQTLRYMGRAHTVIDKGDYLPPRGAEIATAIDADPGITHVVLVHCETSSGILNPVEEIAAVTAEKGRRFLLDSMSAFGALPLDLSRLPCEAAVGSTPRSCAGWSPRRARRWRRWTWAAPRPRTKVWPNASG